MKNTKVERFDGVGTWTYATIPFDCQKKFGSSGRIRVNGTINGHEIKGTLMPHGNGQHFLILSKEIRDTAQVKVGDSITIDLFRENSSEIVAIPEDLNIALNKNKLAKDLFNKLPPSHKKEYIKWIEGAKKDETRKSRIIKTLEKLFSGQRLR